MASRLDVLLLKKSLISRRQAAGILLAFCILLGGRMIRHFLLVGPDGRWKDNLWLESSVYAGENSGKKQKKVKIVLTTPLPINTCSEDSLTLLPGVGKVLAKRIAEARTSGLIFTKPADLKTIKGIGPAMCLRLTPHVVFISSVADSAITFTPLPE